MIFKIKEGITDVQSLFPITKFSKDDIRWIFGSRGCGKTPPEFHGPTSFNIDDPEYQEEKNED